MDSGRYEHVKALIIGALELPVDQRDHYLLRECGEDTDLYHEASAILIHDAGDDLLDIDDRASDVRAIQALVGVSIDGYRLVRLIGEGGMGVVFLAEQEGPLTRKVAVKIIKIGMDTHEVVSRFESERQTLALMNHPGIAKVFDAGATAEGRPYFVMEYIDGLPITRYCAEHQLDLEARLHLFVEACRGIHHAHLRGIIHRDIKPSNILVMDEDGQAVAKVIDFGIAKATNGSLMERTLLTRQGHLLGTPEYMSPEQAVSANPDLDSRCDIYSLGVLLYEILTGCLPVSRSELLREGLAAMGRQLQEQDPVPPSTRIKREFQKGPKASPTLPPTSQTWISRLRRDLDWVTMKALAKNRDRRYASPGELADDLERFLMHKPVEAGPPSRWYRSGRFVRRYRTVVTTAAAVLFTLLAGVIGTTTGMIRADRAEKEAQQATRRSEAGRLFELARAEELPSHALPVLRAAIELNDRPEYRRQVRRNLLREPPLQRLPIVADSHNPQVASFSPDGRWLAVGWNAGGSLQVIPIPSGEPVSLVGHAGSLGFARFTADSRKLVTAGGDSTVRIWDVASATEIDSWRLQGDLDLFLCQEDSLLVVGEISVQGPVRWWSRAMSGGEPVLLGTVERPPQNTISVPFPGVDHTGRWLATAYTDRLELYDLLHLEKGPIREIGQHPRRIAGVVITPRGDQVLSYDAEGLLRIWNLFADDAPPVRTMQCGPNPFFMRFTADRRWLLASSTDGFHVWDLQQSSAARPTILRGSASWSFDAALHPTLPWLVTLHTGATIAAWSLTDWNRMDLDLPEGQKAAMRFSVDGQLLVTASDEGVVTAWPLDGLRVGEPREIGRFPGYRFASIGMDDDAEACILAPCNGYEGIGSVTRLPLDGGPSRTWMGGTCALTVSSDGRYAAFGSDDFTGGFLARVIEMATGTATDLDGPDGGALHVVGFAADGRIYAWGPAGLGSWYPDGTGFIRLGESPHWALMSADRNAIVAVDKDHRWWRFKLDGSTTTELSLGMVPSLLGTMEVDRTGRRAVAGSLDGDLLFVDFERGFLQRLPLADGALTSVAIDPHGRWIAASHDGVVTLLPVPTEPLPLDLATAAYLEWLDTLTNLRLEPDESIEVGFRVLGSGLPDWSQPPRW